MFQFYLLKTLESAIWTIYYTIQLDILLNTCTFYLLGAKYKNIE